MGQTTLPWEMKQCSFYSQKPLQLLRNPLHLPLLPRPQHHRRLTGPEPELHDDLAGGIEELERVDVAMHRRLPDHRAAGDEILPQVQVEARVEHVEPGADGLDAVDIPASRYAVFKHVGHISDFNKTVYTVWNKGLPDAGLTPAKTPDFELYDDRFDARTCMGTVEIWIPVA